MPPWLEPSRLLEFARTHPIQIASASAVLVAAVVIVRLLTRKRVSPGDLERQRRLFVHRNGRLLDGYIVEIDGDVIHFEYSVNGVDYQATQDVAAIRHLLPDETHWAMGPVTLKYVSKNPANSIVICEEWSGLRQRTSA